MTPLKKRDCGPCQACCVALKIEAPELRKAAATPCPHLIAAGCGIYNARPEICRQFLCGWRLFEELGDDWRPDRSGVIVMQRGADQLPRAWRAAPYGVLMVVTGGEAAVRRPAFAEYSARLMGRGIPVFLGTTAHTILVNEHLKGGEDVTALRQRLLELYALLEGASWSVFHKIAFLYRLQLDRARHLLAKPRK
jgi:hypothetical protein